MTQDPQPHSPEWLKKLRDKIAREPEQDTLKRLRELGLPAPWEDAKPPDGEGQGSGNEMG